MSAIKIYSNDSLLIVMWDHRPPGRFAPHDKICDILRAAIKSRISADMLSLRIWYSVIIHITYSLLHTCNFFQMLMQINRSNWGHLQKGALCPMLLYTWGYFVHISRHVGLHRQSNCTYMYILAMPCVDNITAWNQFDFATDHRLGWTNWRWV